MPAASLHPAARALLALVGLAGLLAGAACSEQAPARTDLPEAGATVLGCTNDLTVPIGSGVLINNTWNRASAGAGAWRQCLQSRRRDGVVEHGWFWEWPARDGLYAYPEILIGRSPWRATPSNDARFPRTIAATRALWVEYDVESRFTGKRNLAAEFWLTRGQAAGAAPDPRAIRNELMIWTEASEGLVTASDKSVGTVEIDGVRWAVHVKPDWGDASGGSGIKWQMISYHALTPASKARYDARKFFEDAIRRGWLEAGDTIEGIELGNELVSGSGSTWVRKFSVDVQ